MGTGKQQQQQIPARPPSQVQAMQKPTRRKRMQDLDITNVLEKEKKPEDFIKQIKQLPGQ